jgi:DNA repair protein RadC
MALNNKLAKTYILKKADSSLQKVALTNSNDVVKFARQFYFDDIEIFESFFIILLTRTNNTIGYVKISQGGTAGTVVDMKLIAFYAIETLSAAVILVHNHPSGNTKPSDADKTITKKIKGGLSLFDINVLDHVILSKESYFSFADEGIL